MNYQKDTDPAALVAEAAAELLKEKRHGVTTLIKQILIRQEALAEALKANEIEHTKLQEKLNKSTQRIAKLSTGDWSVLTELQREAADNK